MKDLKIYTVVGFILLGFYLVAQYYRPKAINWEPTLSKNHKIPFGTHVLYNRINDIFPGAEIKYKRDAPYITFTETKTNAGNYIIIAPKVNLDEYDFKKLAEYMRKGNNVFIASHYLGTYLQDSLDLKINSERKFNADEKYPISFINPKLDPAKKYVFNKGIGDQYFSRFDSTKAVVLAQNSKGNATFIKYTYGKGALFLMASPMYFTNYSMLQPKGAEFVEKAFSYLPVKAEIIWDEFSALGPYRDEDSPVRFFLSHEPLKWAYFIALFSLITFVLFEIKRRQRVIPIIEPLQNSSAEFVKVVGQVYYQKRDNVNIAQKIVAYFLEDIRSRYSIKTNTFSEEFLELLHRKSGVKKELIHKLIDQFLQIQAAKKVSDSELITLNKHIEQFQQQSKL